MTKVVINADYGGFTVSDKAKAHYEKISGCPWPYKWELDVNRSDPVFVRVVEELGKEADGCGDLEIVDIPEGTEYIIHEYDGLESIWTKDELNWLKA